MSDGGRERCDTLGCEGTPVERGYCEECINTSPKLRDDPDAAGEAVNPAGGVTESTRNTDSSDTPRENAVAGRFPVSDPKGLDAESGLRDWRSCFADAMRYFNRQIDRVIHDHTEAGDHPDRPTTAREYYNDMREWSDEVIEEYCLGYAPDDRELLDHLRAKGYDREAILGTGLFTVFDDGTISQLWAGRYVLPYYGPNGQRYAISRATGSVGGGKAGYDGHPRDFISGKYGKLAHSKEYARVGEPIFGLDTVREGEPLLIAGGIADAISLQLAGYPCISPVTTVQFKGDHEQQVVELVEGRDIPTVYVVNDNERPSVEVKEIDGEAEHISDVLTIKQYGEGLRGAFGDADFLLDAGIDTRLVELPRAGRSLRKADPDDYLHDGWGDLDTVLAAAKPAEQHPGYDRDDRAMQTAATGLARERDVSPTSYSGNSNAPSGDHSAVFDLDIRDVTGRSWGSRGVNPLGHHGNSENYYVLVERYGVGYDHKYKKAYNALTHLLVEAGERRAESPNGRLDDAEILAAWGRAKGERLIPDDDPIPHRALRHVALSRGLCESADIEDGWKLPVEAYNGALDIVREEYDLDPGREHIDGGVSGDRESFDIEPCRAPAYNPVAVDTDKRRAELETSRIDEWLDLGNGKLMIWGDEAGDGKTTSGGRGLAARDMPFVTLLPKHENCREYELDDAKPEVDLHLKGAAQPLHDCCMDAKVDADEGEKTAYCLEHGHPTDWERMCPIYHRAKDDPIRQLYEALVPEVGPQRAHEILELGEADWHGPSCHWQQQYDELENAERVVTVHNYLTQKTVRGVGKVILDDVQGIDSFTREHEYTVEQLTRAANRLDRLGRIEGTPEALAEFGRFAHDLVSALTGGYGDNEEASTPDVEALDPPELPDHEGWKGEPLAKAKLEYNEAIARDMAKDEWDGEPLAFDALLAAGVHAGLDRAPAMVAAALDAPLETCPQCDTKLEWHGGAATCPGCGWDERADPLTKPYDEPARAQAWLDHEGDHHEDGQTCLAYRALPLKSELPGPNQTLWLDATPTRELAALLFGIDTENVDVTGNEQRALNADVTQITNGQYHRGTIARGTRENDDHSEYGERLRERFQTLIDARCRECEQVLVAGHKKNRALFDLPDNAEWMHYHAGRGLDRSDYDAVVMVGAPHVPEGALRRDAELLTQGRDDVRVGGREFGTRRNEDGELDTDAGPLYRQYYYEDPEEDEDKRGRAAPTKGYSGLMGALFRANREDELHQIGHRVRPGQADADEPKFIDLLTNVPTDLPVDELVELETLTDPLYRQADLPEGAMDMQAAALDALEQRADGRLTGDVRPAMLVETDENGDLAMKAEGWQRLCRVSGVTTRTGTTPSLSTIYDWLERLDALDLLHPENYEQREGRTHSGSIATLNLALEYLSYNVNFKVDVARRFRRFVADGTDVETWLSLLAEAFDPADGVSGGHPPPDPT